MPASDNMIFLAERSDSLDAGSDIFRWYSATRGSVLLLSCPDPVGNGRAKAHRDTDHDQPDGDKSGPSRFFVEPKRFIRVRAARHKGI